MGEQGGEKKKMAVDNRQKLRNQKGTNCWAHAGQEKKETSTLS